MCEWGKEQTLENDERKREAGDDLRYEWKTSVRDVVLYERGTLNEGSVHGGDETF